MEILIYVSLILNDLNDVKQIQQNVAIHVEPSIDRLMAISITLHLQQYSANSLFLFFSQSTPHYNYYTYIRT